MFGEYEENQQPLTLCQDTCLTARISWLKISADPERGALAGAALLLVRNPHDKGTFVV